MSPLSFEQLKVIPQQIVVLLQVLLEKSLAAIPDQANS
jgi:hypothetical protein